MSQINNIPLEKGWLYLGHVNAETHEHAHSLFSISPDHWKHIDPTLLPSDQITNSNLQASFLPPSGDH